MLPPCGELVVMSENPMPLSGGGDPWQPMPSAPGAPGAPGVIATPLAAADPPRIGDYWLDARLGATPSGVAYAAHDDDGTAAMLIVLAAGAAGDAAARDRFAGDVNRMHLDTVLARGGHGQDEGRLAEKYTEDTRVPAAPDDRPLAPWVALAYDGSPAAVAEASRVLGAVDLSRTSLLGRVSGPSYALHWRDNTDPGRTRLWPLPWPARRDRAGWVAILVAWLLTILVAAMALLIAVLAFQNKPPQQAPPPVPTTQEQTDSSPQSPQSSGGSPQSPESSGGGGTPSGSPSMDSPEPSGSESGGGSPSPNRRLILDQRDR